MGNKSPKSQSLSLRVWERAWWTSEWSLSYREGSLEPGGQPAGQRFWQPMPREIRGAWSSTLGCGARLAQQWSGACLSSTLRVAHSTLLGLMISVSALRCQVGNLPRSPQAVHGCSAWHP